MELLVARQPIFDAQMHVFGYEMLFRSSSLNEFDGTEGNTATARVISAVFGSAETDQLTGRKNTFINFPQKMLLDGTASILPPQQTVVEILESAEADEDLLEACRGLRARGYRLALDDFTVAEKVEALTSIADFLKVDFRATSLAQRMDAATRFKGKVQLLAEKVETQEEFRCARDMGYEYFQGFFFARPLISSTRQIPGFKLQFLRILNELHRPEMDFRKLADLLKREPGLSYKLLRFVNSAWFGLRSPVESLQRALVSLGEEAARKWLSVLTMANLASDQPTELAISTLVRARFFESLAKEAGLLQLCDDCFLVGMFSRLDAMLGRPLAELVEGLNLHGQITRTLLDRPHPSDKMPPVWKLVLAYERGDWDTLGAMALGCDLNAQTLTDCYAEAVQWADGAEIA
ncbi:MAG: HDOD domain-containing protein [Bryobacteraceae bacterium]|jgi:EAL and modified HD-GYP domain-containing signal transduction protein